MKVAYRTFYKLGVKGFRYCFVTNFERLFCYIFLVINSFLPINFSLHHVISTCNNGSEKCGFTATGTSDWNQNIITFTLVKLLKSPIQYFYKVFQFLIHFINLFHSKPLMILKDFNYWRFICLCYICRCIHQIINYTTTSKCIIQRQEINLLIKDAISTIFKLTLFSRHICRQFIICIIWKYWFECLWFIIGIRRIKFIVFDKFVFLHCIIIAILILFR